MSRFQISSFFSLVFLTSAMARAADPKATLTILRIDQTPQLADFLDMEPRGHLAEKLAKVEGFIQTQPSDGKPATQRTDVFLGYDDRNLYVILVAFDTEPQKVRGTMTRRENIDNNDDWVEVAIDTFNDQRRAYLFRCNPLGIQWDALHSESTGENASFDALWHSRGQITDRGFVVWMAIPFKSLRFPDTPSQFWGIQFRRWQSRIPELSTWPHISSRIQGRLNQAAQASGLENISPGRNLQFISYATFRSFRALDLRDPNLPRFRQVDGEYDGGLDGKWVLRENLVVDTTVNPDFNQVESDQPQVTTNQRFEVFFPEKRPFFQENATFFETPLNLVFTRRISDPQFGVRLTGKAGPYAIGAILIDDQAPGKRVLEGHPDFDKRALFSIVRVSRDIFKQSTIGVIYTDREFEGSFNRVGGVDGRFKFARNWSSSFQAVVSKTRFGDGAELAGPAYLARLDHNGRQLNFNVNYSDLGEDFVTQPGFVNRTGFRKLSESFTYRLRPEGKFLIAWGPNFDSGKLWDREGTRLDWWVVPEVTFEFIGQTTASFFYGLARERLGPEDFPGLARALDFEYRGWGVRFSSSLIKQLNFSSSFGIDRAVNFVPPVGQQPSLADRTRASLRLMIRPITPLRIQNDYILSRLTDRSVGANIFNNHIFRSNWNWQFNRELSLRLILQYDTLLTNPQFSRLDTRKNINADFLLTYLVNPGTALFIGYNSNAQNIELLPTSSGAEIIRAANRFANDGRQLFVKFSYLFRF